MAERRKFSATLRVELEDVTATQAREFWDKLKLPEFDLIEVEGYEATITSVEPDPL